MADSDTPPTLKTEAPPLPAAPSQTKNCVMIGGCLLLAVALIVIPGILGVMFLVEKMDQKSGAIEEARKQEMIERDRAIEKTKQKQTEQSGNSTPPASTEKSIPVPGDAQKKNILASKDKPYLNSIGMRFVPVPIEGGPSKGKRILFSIWETRMQDYATYMDHLEKEADKENGDEAPEWNQDWKNLRWKRKIWNPEDEEEMDHPVVNVSVEDAKAFCEWLTRLEQAAGRLGPDDVYRLPSDSEWSYAVGIGEQEFMDSGPTQSKGNIMEKKISPEQRSGKVKGFPWGEAWPPPNGVGNYSDSKSTVQSSTGRIKGYEDGFAHTAPAGSYPPNSFGLYDLGGNVWEFCDERHAIKVIPKVKMADGVDPNVQFPKTKKNYVLRGGSWINFTQPNLLSSHRSPVSPGTRNPSRGFRVVIENGNSSQ